MPRHAAETLAFPAKFADAAAVAGALTPDDPLFCFSPAALKAEAHVFLSRFPGLVTYAVKSNPTPQVIHTLAEAGIEAWDVASVQEMELVRDNASHARFHYHNPVKSRREIERAYHDFACRRFAADCIEEVEKIHAVVQGDGAVEIAIRLVLPRDRSSSSAHDFSTKFGAPEHVAAELLKRVKALGYLALLTFHPGSQTKDPQVYVRHIEAAARITRLADMTIPKLNVGGGFPANYLFSTAPEPTVYFRIITSAVQKFFGSALPLLECEPGRGLVAECMSLLTRVKLVCTDGDDIFINDGVYGGLMELMQVPELAPPFRVIRDGRVVTGPTKSYKVFGPTCDPLDVLPARLDLVADLRDGDFIEFGTLGAYGVSTRTRFNGYGLHDVLTVDEVFTL